MGRKASTRGKPKQAAGKEKEFSVWDESESPYPCFQLDLNPDKFAKSHAELMKRILALILETVEEEMKRLPHKDKKPTKLHGKHYTPLGGAFLVELLIPDDDAHMGPVTLLFGLKDLYLQGFHVAAVWYMLRRAEVPIPPWSQIQYGQGGRRKRKDRGDRRKREEALRDGQFRLPWTGDYSSLWPGKYQEFHYSAFRKASKTLRRAPEIVLTTNINELRTPIGFHAVGISECVRFSEICDWVVAHSTDPLIVFGVTLPKEKIKDLGEWATNSDKCYEDDPPKRLRLIKRNLEKHSLMKCETKYEKIGKPTAKDSAADTMEGDGKGKEQANSEEAEMDKEDRKEEPSAIDDQEFEQRSDDESEDEEDDIPDDDESSSVDFSADRHLAACISADGKVNIRESYTQKLIGTLECDSEVKWVKWNLDGSFIVGGSASHEAWVWSIEHSAAIRKLPTPVTCGDFSANGNYLCTGSGDGSLRIWTPNLECRHAVAVGGAVSCLVITPESGFVISGSRDGSILVVEMESGLVIGSLVGHMGSSSVTCLAISPLSSNIMASGRSDGKVMIWDLVGQKLLCVCFNEAAAVRSLTWIGQTKYVAGGCEDGRVSVWDSKTGLRVTRSRKFDRISKLMMSPCGNQLVVFASGPAQALDVSMFR